MTGVRQDLTNLDLTQAICAELVEAGLKDCEWAINEAHGVAGMAYFQLNDGPDANAYEHRFGMRTIDGVWKPVADA